MFNNIFCEIKGKQAIDGEGGVRGNGGTVEIASWKCNLGIYLDIQVYYFDIQAITTLLCLLLVIYVLIPSIHSFFYLTTPLLKSDVFRLSKAYSSHSFQPTGICLGSLCRGNRCVLPIIGLYLKICIFFYTFLKLSIFRKKAYFKKFHKILYYFFFKNLELVIHIYLLNALITSNFRYL